MHVPQPATDVLLCAAQQGQRGNSSSRQAAAGAHVGVRRPRQLIVQGEAQRALLPFLRGQARHAQRALHELQSTAPPSVGFSNHAGRTAVHAACVAKPTCLCASARWQVRLPSAGHRQPVCCGCREARTSQFVQAAPDLSSGPPRCGGWRPCPSAVTSARHHLVIAMGSSHMHAARLTWGAGRTWSVVRASTMRRMASFRERRYAWMGTPTAAATVPEGSTTCRARTAETYCSMMSAVPAPAQQSCGRCLCGPWHGSARQPWSCRLAGRALASCQPELRRPGGREHRCGQGRLRACVEQPVVDGSLEAAYEGALQAGVRQAGAQVPHGRQALWVLHHDVEELRYARPADRLVGQEPQPVAPLHPLLGAVALRQARRERCHAGCTRWAPEGVRWSGTGCAGVLERPAEDMQPIVAAPARASLTAWRCRRAGSG